MKRAIERGTSRGWTRYGWFVDLVNELLDDLPGKPLDG